MYQTRELVPADCSTECRTERRRSRRKGRGADKQTIQVSVFPMKVSRRERLCPEKGQRKAIWFLSTQQEVWFIKSC